MIGFASEYTTEGSSNLRSLGKRAFSHYSWKIWSTLMNSTPLFRKGTLQILAGVFLLALDIVGSNILD